MSNKYAIYFDGGFVCKILKSFLGKDVEISDIEEALNLIKQSEKLNGKELLRAYYYDSPPYKGTSTDPNTNALIDFGATNTYKRQMSFHEAVKFHSDFALRCGDLKFRDWKKNNKGVFIPDFQQKGVDVKIALDIAQMSMKHIIDSVVLFSGDIDITPALKLARREGIRVYYVNVSNAKSMFIGDEVKIHSDGVINITFNLTYKKGRSRSHVL